jgi:Flp pilus assembly pilin Flp
LKALQELFKKVSVSLLNEKAQTLVEYALLLVLISVVVIIMLKGTGEEVNSIWSKINSGITR